MDSEDERFFRDAVRQFAEQLAKLEQDERDHQLRKYVWDVAKHTNDWGFTAFITKKVPVYRHMKLIGFEIHQWINTRRLPDPEGCQKIINFPVPPYRTVRALCREPAEFVPMAQMTLQKKLVGYDMARQIMGWEILSVQGCNIREVEL